MKRITLNVALFGAWCGLAWVMLLHGLGSFGLLGPDEPRYAAIAAAMLGRHDFITPRLWGAVWFEKPVLFYWLAALSDWGGHVGDSCSRLPNAMFAILLSLALWIFLRRTHSAIAGALVAFFSLTSTFLFIFGRAATTDMTLTAPLALGLMSLYLWWQSDQRRWISVAAVMLALATLAKGPVALVLAALVMAGFAATQRGGRRLRRLFSPLPIVLFAGVAAPWYLLVGLRNPAFFKIFFLQHNLERFATNRFEHPQPFWFYLPVLLLAVFPWTGWLGLPLQASLSRLRRLGWRVAWDGREDPLKFFLGLWVLAPVVFFSLSQSKLPGYILPAIPAAAALTAVCAAEQWNQLPHWPLAISAVLAGLVPTAVGLTPWFLAPSASRPAFGAMVRNPTVGMLAVGTTAILLILVLRRRPIAVVAATCILTAAAVAALTRPPLSTAADLVLSGRPLAQQLGTQCSTGLPSACGNVPLYVWRLNRSLLYGVQFYLGASLPEWPDAVPANANATIVVNRAAIPAFVARYGGSLQIAAMSRFNPSLHGPAAPWIVLRVRSR